MPELAHRLHCSLAIGVVGDGSASAIPLEKCRDATLEEIGLGNPACQECHLSIERACGLPSDRATGAADSVHHLPLLHGNACRKRSPQLEENEGDLIRSRPSAHTLLLNAKPCR